jgi:hypothetical protein
MTSTADAPRLRAFARDDADAVIAFCAGHGPYDAGLLRRLLLDLTSGPAGVLVIEDREGPALVATVVDRVDNILDAANLETLGVRAPLTADAFMQLVVEPAIAFVRGGERGALSVGLHAATMPAAGAEAALRAAGFAHAYDGFEMKRPGATQPADAPHPLPAGWSWRTVDAALADEAHAALGEAFRDAPSASRVPLEEFRRWVAAGASVYRALLDGDRVAGLVRSRRAAPTANCGSSAAFHNTGVVAWDRGWWPRRCGCCARAGRATSSSRSKPRTIPRCRSNRRFGFERRLEDAGLHAPAALTLPPLLRIASAMTWASLHRARDSARSGSVIVERASVDSHIACRSRQTATQPRARGAPCGAARPQSGRRGRPDARRRCRGGGLRRSPLRRPRARTSGDVRSMG